MKKIFMAMILACASGYVCADELQSRITALPEAYRELGQGCQKAGSFSCCMSSVDAMVLARAVLREEGQECPAGYRPDMLKCEGSYAWCEPVAREDSVARNPSLEEATLLIEKYVHDRPPENTFDWISPYFSQIAQMGAAAVEPLASALREEDPAYVEASLSFVYLLGVIGDARAYPVLRDWFLRQEDETDQWRAAISLGACLPQDKAGDYVNLVVSASTGGALRALQEMSGQDWGQDQKAWTAYLDNAENLKRFREDCQGRSAPILG